MPHYGVCSSGEVRCGLSYQNHALARLPELIRVTQQSRHEGHDADELIPKLDGFVRFFQEGLFCSECSGPLLKMMRPTTRFAPESEEYRRTVKANAMVEAVDYLKAVGKLRA